MRTSICAETAESHYWQVLGFCASNPVSHSLHRAPTVAQASREEEERTGSSRSRDADRFLAGQTDSISGRRQSSRPSQLAKFNKTTPRDAVKTITNIEKPIVG